MQTIGSKNAPAFTAFPTSLWVNAESLLEAAMTGATYGVLKCI
jgi:hypothetical protein